jgi:hypothetical protein
MPMERQARKLLGTCWYGRSYSTAGLGGGLVTAVRSSTAAVKGGTYEGGLNSRPMVTHSFRSFTCTRARGIESHAWMMPMCLDVQQKTQQRVLRKRLKFRSWPVHQIVR